MENEKKEASCCGGNCSSEKEHIHSETCSHEETSVNPANPFANLDKGTQKKIQELQMLEQNFQQFMQQKNAFSMELNETNYIIDEVEKSEGTFSRLIGGQVIISSSKETILKDMKKKKELIEKRTMEIDAQEKEFTDTMNTLREEVMKAIQA